MSEKSVKEWLQHYDVIAEVIKANGKGEAAREFKRLAYKRALLSGYDRSLYATETV